MAFKRQKVVVEMPLLRPAAAGLRRAGGRVQSSTTANSAKHAPEVRLPNLWWRCRELNPGPTCTPKVCTIMIFSVLPPDKRRSEKKAEVMTL